MLEPCRARGTGKGPGGKGSRGVTADEARSGGLVPISGAVRPGERVVTHGAIFVPASTLSSSAMQEARSSDHTTSFAIIGS